MLAAAGPLADLRTNTTDKEGVVAMQDGHLVSRESDFIIYSVEAEYLDGVVKQYGPCKLADTF